MSRFIYPIYYPSLFDAFRLAIVFYWQGKGFKVFIDEMKHIPVIEGI